MNREDIIKLALKAGCIGPGEGGDPNGLWEPHGHENVTDLMMKFAALVIAEKEKQIIAANAPEIERINTYIKELEEAVAAEREACAKAWHEGFVEGWKEAGGKTRAP